MTLNSSALSLGTALGGAAGGVALSLGGYVALGICSPIFLIVGSAIVWLARPRAATAFAATRLTPPA
jgi:predicted MFS family arabinose efflux permease